MKKMESTKKLGAKSLIVGGGIALIFAIILWGILLYVEKATLGNYTKRVVVVAEGNIAEGSKITEGMYSLKEIDTRMAPDNALSSADELKDMIAVANISGNAMITKEMVGERKAMSNGTKVVGLTTNDLSSAVNGILRTSDRIDIYLISEDGSGQVTENQDGQITETSLALKSVYVDAVFDADNKKISNSDTETVASSFNVLLTEEEATMIMNAKGKKLLAVVKCD